MTKNQIIKALAKYNISVRSVEECARAELHICATDQHPEFGLKEHEGVCSECGGKVYFTQIFPADGPQPRKICIQCSVDLARGEKTLSI